MTKTINHENNAKRYLDQEITAAVGAVIGYRLRHRDSKRQERFDEIVSRLSILRQTRKTLFSER